MAIGMMIKPIVKMLSKIFFYAVLILAASFRFVNLGDMFDPIFGMFGYSSDDIRELKGKDGFFRIFRSFNRSYVLDGLFLTMFDPVDYSKEEIEEDTRSRQNFYHILKFFLTIGIVIAPIAKLLSVTLSPLEVLEFTIFRFGFVVSFAELIRSYVFLTKPNSPESLEKLKLAGEKSEEIKTRIEAAETLIVKAEEEVAAVQVTLSEHNKELDKGTKLKDDKATKEEGKAMIVTATKKIEDAESLLGAKKEILRQHQKQKNTEMKSLKKNNEEYKDYRYKLLVEDRELQPWLTDLIKKDPDGPEGPQKPVENYRQKLDNLILVVSFLGASCINYVTNSMVYSKDPKPLRYSLILLAFGFGFVSPSLNMAKGFQTDFADLYSKKGVFQNFVNKYHPDSIDPTLEVVKKGINYDPFYTLQFTLLLFSVSMTFFHIYFGITEWPKDLEDCDSGPMDYTPDVVEMGPSKNRQVCPEDSAAIGRRGYFPIRLQGRLFSSPLNKFRFELVYMIVPLIAGITEGEESLKEARREGIKSKSIKGELKKKGYIFGYWRACLIILLCLKLEKNHLLGKAKSATSSFKMPKFKMPKFKKR